MLVLQLSLLRRRALKQGMMDSRAQYSRGRRQGDCAPRHHHDRTDQGVMAEPAGRPSDVQVRTPAEEDEYGVPTPRARAAELRAADPRLETAGQIVEAVGIENSAFRADPGNYG